MKHKWLEKNNSDSLIIFFNGWGMDETPFTHLKTENTDLLMVNDYATLDTINVEELKHYANRTLIAWSMGVWAASQVISDDWNIDYTIAINGTPFPIHDDFGIPPIIYQKTLDSMSAASQLRFFQRMFANRDLFKQFLKVKPQRELDNQITELANLQQMVLSSSDKEFSFNKVIVNNNDRIIPGKNQLSYWKNHKHVITIEEGHFPFFIWNSWEDIIRYEG